MNRKSVVFSVAILLAIVCITVPLPAFEDSISFEQCAKNANNKCMVPLPELNQGNGTANPNEFITANFPQNGSPVVEGVLSHDNFTKFENAVGVARVTFSTTTMPVSLNLCPVDKLELESQDGYLGQYFYNTTRIPVLNLTHYIYPDFCYAETGPNPIDHSYIKPTTVPEFGAVVQVIGLIAIIGSNIIIAKAKGLRLK